MVLRLGFVVNPVAGIGGPAGLKGSDDVALEAAERGYTPTAEEKARRFLTRLKERAHPGSVRIFAAAGVMGARAARQTGWRTGALGSETMEDDPFATDAGDTHRAAQHAAEVELDLIVFVGGDGTARDVAAAAAGAVPVLGVPAGVKMFSECFAETPEAAADLVAEIAGPPRAEGDPVETAEGELLDLDEAAYREGRLAPRTWGVVPVPRSPRIIAAKCPLALDSDVTAAALEVVGRMRAAPDALYVLGSGSTLMAVKDRLGVDGSLIGVDVVEAHGEAWRLVAADVDAHALERHVADATRAKRPVVRVQAPIGGQGFVIGRGTGPFTPEIVRAALPDGIWVVATREKLATLRDRALHIDTGDPELDQAFPAHLRVITAPGRESLMPVSRTDGD